MTQMADLDDFLPSMKVYAPGLSDLAAYFGLRQAAIEFCEKTRVWKFEDTYEYSPDDGELLSPEGSVIHEIEVVKFDGRELRKVTPQWLDRMVPNWRGSTETLSGAPEYVTQTVPNNIILVPSATGELYYSLYLKPSQDCTTLPAFLADQHRETIAWGALARVLMIPNQAFTDVQMAVGFATAFQAKIDGKSTLGVVGQQRAPVRTRASFM